MCMHNTADPSVPEIGVRVGGQRNLRTLGVLSQVHQPRTQMAADTTTSPSKSIRMLMVQVWCEGDCHS